MYCTSTIARYHLVIRKVTINYSEITPSIPDSTTFISYTIINESRIRYKKYTITIISHVNCTTHPSCIIVEIGMNYIQITTTITINRTTPTRAWSIVTCKIGVSYTNVSITFIIDSTTKTISYVIAKTRVRNIKTTISSIVNCTTIIKPLIIDEITISYLKMITKVVNSTTITSTTSYIII